MSALEQRTRPYGEVLVRPQGGPGVCEVCFNLTAGYARCLACTRGELWLDAMVPISYSIGHEHLHHVLRDYKRTADPETRELTLDLAAVVDRFLRVHESCLARACGVGGFELVTTVPSSDARRDDAHPLRWIVGSLVEATGERHRRVLCRSDVDALAHGFCAARYVATRSVRGRSVLLIDDMWTTGANAQSAAAALRAAGAERVAAVVIGRHVNRTWRENDRRLRELERPYDWSRCALCCETAGSADAGKPAQVAARSAA